MPIGTRTRRTVPMLAGLVTLLLFVGASSAEAQTCSSDADCFAPEQCSIAGVCACGGVVCGDGGSCCDEGSGGPVCVSLDSDERHCGACDQVCSGEEECSDGQCVCWLAGGGFEVCGQGETCCLGGGGCTDLTSDPDNCGFCINQCGTGETCEGGNCTCGNVIGTSAVCSPDGACCGSPPTCVEGEVEPCGCGSTTCPAGTECCDATRNLCADPSTDRNHCGACGIECGPSMQCEGGSCRCERGFGNCDDALANGCEAQFATDDANCGECGNLCPRGSSCEDGTCQPRCPTGQTACGDVADGFYCADTNDDAMNCGSCGNVCPVGTRCDGGSCGPDCGVNQQFCGGICVDVSRDEQHCGECGASCGPGEQCSAGRCEPSCQSGLDLCGARCTNLRNDPGNCGACDRACPAGTICDGAACRVTCQEGLELCDGRCTDVSVDRRHCGGCGLPCAEGQICSEGMCEGIEMDRANTGPVLYVPLWRLDGTSSQLVVHKPSEDPVRVVATFVDATGALLGRRTLVLDNPARQTVTVALDTIGELAGHAEGGVFLFATEISLPGELSTRPWVGAEVWMIDAKTKQLDRIEALNARTGVWTTFADTWAGPLTHATKDELLLFCPSGDLATALFSTGDLPGNPALGFADEVRIEFRDDRGLLLGATDVPCAAVTSIRAEDHIKGGTPANVLVTPLPVASPDDSERREDAVYLAMTKRSDEAAGGPRSVKKGAIGVGYLFSVPGGDPRTPLPPCPTGSCF